MTDKIKETEVLRKHIIGETESVTLWERMVCIIQTSDFRKERIMKSADTDRCEQSI